MGLEALFVDYMTRVNTESSLPNLTFVLISLPSTLQLRLIPSYSSSYLVITHRKLVLFNKHDISFSLQRVQGG